jgi:hypothetical protein
MTRMAGQGQGLIDIIRPRMIPSLLVTGAMKAGTSALFRMLAEHPQVVPPLRKELHFFNNDAEYSKGFAHYLGHFQRRPWRPGRFVSFEASPSYLPLEKAAERIAGHLPGVLLVAILRDPVERAYSAWNMYHGAMHRPKSTMGPDPRSFEQAVEDELAGVPALLQHRYLYMGDYAEHLLPYLRLFPREHLLLFGYPHFKQRPADVVNSIFEHWRLTPLDPAHPVFSNRTNAKPYAAPMDPGLKERLYAHFGPRVERLYELLGRDLAILER